MSKLGARMGVPCTVIRWVADTEASKASMSVCCGVIGPCTAPCLALASLLVTAGLGPALAAPVGRVVAALGAGARTSLPGSGGAVPVVGMMLTGGGRGCVRRPRCAAACLARAPAPLISGLSCGPMRDDGRARDLCPRGGGAVAPLAAPASSVLAPSEEGGVGPAVWPLRGPSLVENVVRAAQSPAAEVGHPCKAS